MLVGAHVCCLGLNSIDIINMKRSSHRFNNFYVKKENSEGQIAAGLWNIFHYKESHNEALL